MAPNSSTNKSKKPYGLMIQPALPLIPGSKSQKTRSVAVEPEPVVVDSLPATEVVKNSAVTHVEQQPAFEESESGIIDDGTAEVNGTSAIADDSQYLTPPQSRVPSEELAEDVQDSSRSTQEETENGASNQIEVQVVGVGNAVEVANDANSDTAMTSPATKTDPKQETGVPVESPIAGTIELATANGDGEDRQESVSPESLLPDLTEQPTVPAYVNGNGSSQSPPVDNGAFVSQQEQVDRGYEAPQAVSSEDGGHGVMVNGSHQSSTTAALAPPATVPRSFSALPSLGEHLLLLAATKEGVDVLIQVNASNTQPFATYSHSIILLRSLRMRRLVTRQQQANNNYGGNVITLYPARYVMPHAFEAALRFLYSDTVLGKDFFVQPHSGTDYQTVRIHNLDYLMSYWVSGIELGLEPVSICAERLLSSYLDWDILEVTYKYATELANSPITSHGKNMTGSDYLVASSSIVKLILQFLANHIDIKNFKLDTASTQSLTATRLPQQDDGRAKHNLALAGMVFGSMPSSGDMSPSSPQSEVLSATSTFKDTIASNILLNVDFENLFAFNNFIQGPTIRDAATRKLMADIVSEREARRQKVHTSRVSNKERMANSAAWEPVGIKESILDTNVLHRDRVGFLAPSKN